MSGRKIKFPFLKISLLLVIFGIYLVLHMHSTYAQNTVNTDLTVNPQVINLGNTVTFNASVTDTTVGGSTPTGTVTFMDGGNVLGSTTLNETIPIVDKSYPHYPPSTPVGLQNPCGGSCPIIKWGDYTYWIFSYVDNRS